MSAQIPILFGIWQHFCELQDQGPSPWLRLPSCWQSCQRRESIHARSKAPSQTGWRGQVSGVNWTTKGFISMWSGDKRLSDCFFTFLVLSCILIPEKSYLLWNLTSPSNIYIAADINRFWMCNWKYGKLLSIQEIHFETWSPKTMELGNFLPEHLTCRKNCPDLPKTLRQNQTQ